MCLEKRSVFDDCINDKGRPDFGFLWKLKPISQFSGWMEWIDFTPWYVFQVIFNFIQSCSDVSSAPNFTAPV